MTWKTLQRVWNLHHFYHIYVQMGGCVSIAFILKYGYFPEEKCSLEESALCSGFPFSNQCQYNPFNRTKSEMESWWDYWHSVLETLTECLNPDWWIADTNCKLFQENMRCQCWPVIVKAAAPIVGLYYFFPSQRCRQLFATRMLRNFSSYAMWWYGAQIKKIKMRWSIWILKHLRHNNAVIGFSNMCWYCISSLNFGASYRAK